MNLEYFKLAKELNDNYKNILLENSVHFRGSLNSMAMISLSHEKPELGISCNTNKYKSTNDTQSIILQDINKIRAKQKPQRFTPEKVLQSWIINYSINNYNKMPFDSNIKFITSELAMFNNERTKIITDILGYHTIENKLCIIEIKTDRKMKDLIKQVLNFENIIIEKPDFFKELLILYNFPYSENLIDSKKIVIWPHKDTSPKIEFKKLNIFEFTYQNHFVFKYYG